MLCSVKRKLPEKRRTEIKMSFPSNYNKYNFKPRNEQSIRLILKRVKQGRFSWFWAAILRISYYYYFFSELLPRYVKTWHRRSQRVVLPWEQTWFCCWFVWNYGVWVNEVISLESVSTSPTSLSPVLGFFLNPFLLLSENTWLSSLGQSKLWISRVVYQV